IDGLLGAGGMGEVYLATDLALQRTVALKVLAPTLAADRDVVARFEREARAASSIDHPAVARIYHFGRSGCRPYYAMEHVDGHSLATLLRVGRIPGQRCVQWLREAAEGREAASAD